MALWHLLYFSLIYDYLLLAAGVDCTEPPSGLQATLSKVTLPVGLLYYSIQAVFDGKDSIYVIGGWNFDIRDHCTIFQYSISSDQINCVANLTDAGARFGDGTANLGKNGRIYLSTAGNDPFNIYEFDPQTNRVRGLAAPMTSRGFLYSVVTNSGSLILLNEAIGVNNTVYEWDINSTTYRTVGQLPFLKRGGSVHYLPESNKILIVGSDFESRTMALFDIETGVTDVLPSINWSIYSGNDVVVNGELFRFGESIKDKFLWYDLSGKNQATVELKDFPYNGLFWAYTGVYVKPLNRVYMFGGSRDSVGQVNDIWYVDLSSHVI